MNQAQGVTVEEWAIRDEATGEWWNDNYFVKYAPKDAEPTRFREYERAAIALVRTRDANFGRKSARIVPAPPKPMSDAECLVWAQENRVTLNARGIALWSCEFVDQGVLYETGDRPSLFEAIRAAAAKNGTAR